MPLPCYDWLIVGAGYTGAVLAERLARARGARVLVVERRPHVGGNAHDARDGEGVLQHLYGPHLFHTNARRVVDYLSRFTDWVPYEHRVLGLVENRLVPIPFNLDSLALLFPPARAARLEAKLVAAYGAGATVPILKLRQSADAEIAELAEFVYERVFLGYTTKQWGVGPEDLSPSVTARVPVRLSRDDRYFQDTWQQLPAEGYTRMFERILDRPGIEVMLGTDYADVKDAVRARRVVYSGAIDEYFDYALGALPYRTLRFEREVHDMRCFQPAAQINYPMSEDFTRITEVGHLMQVWGARTTTVREYPGAHRPGATEPYYPVPRDDNRALHDRYRALAAREAPHVTFAGRLGDYRYYDMDQAVGRALALFEKGLGDA